MLISREFWEGFASQYSLRHRLLNPADPFSSVLTYSALLEATGSLNPSPYTERGFILYTQLFPEACLPVITKPCPRSQSFCDLDNLTVDSNCNVTQSTFAYGEKDCLD